MLLIADIVIHSPKRIEELWQIATSDVTNSWRAAWALSHINEKQRDLLTPYLTEIIAIVVSTNNLSLKRELIKILLEHPLPEDPSAQLLDSSIATITSRTVPVGLRMYSMSVVDKYCDRYPELTAEFMVILDEIISEPPSVGMKGWAKRLVKKYS